MNYSFHIKNKSAFFVNSVNKEQLQFTMEFKSARDMIWFPKRSRPIFFKLTITKTFILLMKTKE